MDGDVTVERRAMVHGGDLTAARARFGAAFGDHAAGWVDLSTGINPLAYPVGDIAAASWGRLPDRAALVELETVAARAFAAAPGIDVVATPGTQAIIQALPRLLPARDVAILGFTYQEHALAWAESGAEVRAVASLDELARAEIGVVVNPNNPDGRLIAPDVLVGLGRRMAARGGRLIVDEAFMDLAPAGASLMPRQPEDGTVVLRSFGKTYGLAGLRLGFAAAGPWFTERLRRDMGPWAVAGPALEIGARAYADTAWLDATRTRLAVDGARLDALMASAGFEIVGGTLLFRLYGHDAADAWYQRLGEAGILVRPFPARPRWLRFGLPGCAADWDRLRAVARG